MKKAFPAGGNRCILEAPKTPFRASMIRHQVYFDTLGSMKEDTASWRSVFAGLSVLRFVDSYSEPGSAVNPSSWAQAHSVRAAINDVSEGDPVRGVLITVVDELSNRGTIDETVSSSLLAYGRALDYEASWGLATDVFTTVAKLAKPERNARLAVEAHVAVGGAARRNGDWETSARAYSQAAYIADTLGDRTGVLTVQVGIANNYMAKGNLPQAQSILDDVLVQSRDHQLGEVQAIALHSRSALAHKQGEFAEAVKLAYEALHLTNKPTAKDSVLADLAGSLSELGLLQAARDAHLILATTSQNQWVRWQATINLLELASREGMERAFDDYAAELRQSRLSPTHKAYFLLFLGEGLARFGRYESAQEVLLEAVAFASANQLNQIAFEADKALVLLNSARQTHKPLSAPLTHSHDLGFVLDGLSNLREAAFAASAR
ncbi:MAG: tetratricopeptide repeat protein [Gemmatimonadaceae bacterium]